MPRQLKSSLAQGPTVPTARPLSKSQAHREALAVALYEQWRKDAPLWLDSRRDKSEPITAAEVTGSLLFQRLSETQISLLLLTWLAHGFLAVAKDSSGAVALFDTRAVWLDDFDGIARRSIAAAGEMLRQLSAELPMKLQRRLRTRITQLEHELDVWGSVPIDAPASERNWLMREGRGHARSRRASSAVVRAFLALDPEQQLRAYREIRGEMEQAWLAYQRGALKSMTGGVLCSAD